MKPRLYQHETEILDFFGGDREKTRITGKLPGKGVFVLFTNRCGSNYLVELMQQLPTLTMRNEMFNSANVIRVCGNRKLNSFEDYVRFMRKDCKTPNWGAKVGCVQIDMLHRFGLFDAFEGGAHIVWLKRKNIIAQAVSHYIAHHSKQWASFHEAKGEIPPFDFSAINRIVASILQHMSDAQLSLSLLNLRHHSLWYEDYLEDTQGHMQRIADFIGEPYEPVDGDQSKFKKQGDPIKEEYEARYRAEARRRLDL